MTSVIPDVQAQEVSVLINRIIQKAIAIGLSTTQHNCNCETYKLAKDLAKDVSDLILKSLQQQSQIQVQTSTPKIET